MSDNLCCLVLHEGNLINDAIAYELLLTAQEMLRDHRKRRKIRTSTYEGLVTTEFQPGALVDRTGYIFHARVEMDPRPLRITYIVRPLDKGEGDEPGSWVGEDRDYTEEELDGLTVYPSINESLRRRHGYN